MKLSKYLYVFIVLTFIESNGFCGLNVDVSYWRISAGKSSFKESISESDERTNIPGTGLMTADVESGRPVWEIETDASKYLFDISYTFDESLHRLTAGYQYASAGNSEVKETTWTRQDADIRQVLLNQDFSADKLVYSNFYLNYRLLPFESDSITSNTVLEKGLDLIFCWVKFDQSYDVIMTDSLDEDQDAETNDDISVTFNTSTKSIGFGIGGEQRLKNTFLGIEGRMVYLPFFDFAGSGWDSELRVTYDLLDYVTLYVGGKWYSVDVETKETIKNIAHLEGFSNSEATFKGLEVDIAGYVIGVEVKF